MSEHEQRQNPKRLTGWPVIGMRQLVSFDKVAGPEEAAQYRASQRAIQAEEDRRDETEESPLDPAPISNHRFLRKTDQELLDSIGKDRMDKEIMQDSEEYPTAIIPRSVSDIPPENEV